MLGEFDVNVLVNGFGFFVFNDVVIGVGVIDDWVNGFDNVIGEINVDILFLLESCCDIGWMVLFFWLFFCLWGENFLIVKDFVFAFFEGEGILLLLRVVFLLIWVVFKFEFIFGMFFINDSLGLLRRLKFVLLMLCLERKKNKYDILIKS